MLKIGEISPNFSVKALDGRTVTQSDFVNRSKVMVFVGPDCPICKEHMPQLQYLYPKAQKSGIELIVISLANAEETELFAKENNFSAPIYSAPKDINSIHKDFKIAGTPQYIVDKGI